LRRGDIVDSLRMGWKVPEPRERLTMSVIVGVSTEDHFLEKPSGYRVRIRLFVGTVEQDLIGFRFPCRPEGRKTGGVDGGEGVCGNIAGKMLVREIRSLEIPFVKKEAKLSASEVTKVEEGKGDEDLRCSNPFTVCQRRRGFSDEKETKCE